MLKLMPVISPAKAAFLIVVAIACGACQNRERPVTPPATSEKPAEAPPTERVVGPLSAEDAAALATMTDRINQYVDLHTRLERGMPDLPVAATPEQIDTRQRALEKAVRAARANARQGDIFTPQAQPVIRRLLATVFGGHEGAVLKDSIFDENPVGITVTVNGRYPDSVPLSTVPPQVLQTLPKLGEDMEYRFIGNRVVLYDVHAHLIADYIDDVFPH